MLAGGFQATVDPTRDQVMITKRSTVQKKPVVVGEEVKSKTTEQDLIFTALGNNEQGTTTDKKGIIEVVLYQVTEKKVSEIIKKPRPEIQNIQFGIRSGMKSFEEGTKEGGFSTGETTFGRETRRKVNIQGVQVDKPLAVFRVVLVGEMPEKNIQMLEQPRQ